MKQFLLIVSFVLTNLLSFGQDSTVIKTYDHVKNDLVKVLEGPGKHVLELATKQVVIDAYCSIWMISIIFIVFLIVSIFFTYADSKLDWDVEGPMVFCWIVTAALFIISVIIIGCQISVLQNPEYQAIRNILGSVK